MIPLVFHFGYFRGAKNWEWRDVHTLCIRTCLANVKPDKLIIHYDKDGDGPHWDAVKALPGVEWRLEQPISQVNGYDVSDQRQPHDVFRLQTLVPEGGFYADLDFVFFKPFDTLRHHEAIIGTQCKQKMKLACGLMGCIPGSKYMTEYLSRVKDWDPKVNQKKFWLFSNCVPWELAMKMPDSVKVLDRVLFYPVTWSNKSFWTGSPVKLTNSHCLHLWEHLHPTLTVEDLRKTCLRDVIDRLDEPAAGVVKVGPGILMTF